MEHRYSLRFESGERRGESIPITGAGLTVGRKPGNSLQILDNSVSGSHAELVVGPEGVLLRDTGSTNGTRVGTQRVIEQQLADGDTVLFGNVRMTFRDGRVAGTRDAGATPPKAPKVAQPEMTPPGGIELEGLEDLEPTVRMSADSLSGGADDAVLHVSPEVMARSGSKRSFAGGLVVVAALAVVGAGIWFWLNQGGSGEGEGARAVEAVAGNLIPLGYSFESTGAAGEDEAWTPAEGATAGFLKSGAARRTGAFGLSADLEGGEWALHRSAPVRASGGRELTARGFLRTEGECEARLGIELSNDLFADAAAPAAVIAWGAPVTGADDFEAVEVTAVIPPGWTQARAVLLARSSGQDQGASEVAADDVSLVESGREGQPAASAGTASLYVLGAPPRSAELLKGERVLVSHMAAVGGDEADPWADLPLATHADGLRLLVEPQGTGARAMQLRAEEPLAHARVATIGSDGYRTHGLDFERSAVDALLLGSGGALVRVKLSSPAQVKGQAEGAATRITITPPQQLEVQLDFSAERKEAGNIAYAARSAEQKGELGSALLQWTALLDAYPFEDALVNEAEAARTRLVQKGLADLRAVQAEIERARFFRLADLYRKCQAEALAVGARYKKSEVEVEARKVAETVTADIKALDVDIDRVERQRMRGILAALEARKATGLAEEVRTYLKEKLGDEN